MPYDRRRMNISTTTDKIVCTALLVLLSAALSLAAGNFCRGIDCRTDMGRQMCRVCARPAPGKRTDTPSVRELFAARLNNNADEDDEFNKYSDPDVSDTCVLDSVIRRLSPRLRTEIIEILDSALSRFAVDDFRKWTDD